MGYSRKLDGPPIDLYFAKIAPHTSNGDGKNIPHPGEAKACTCEPSADVGGAVVVGIDEGDVVFDAETEG